MGTENLQPLAWQQLGTENLQPSRLTVVDRKSATLQGNSWGPRICNLTAGQQLGTENLQPYSWATVGEIETATPQQSNPTAGQQLGTNNLQPHSRATVGEYTENVQPCSMAVIEDKVSLLYSMTGMCNEIKSTKTKKSGRKKYIHEV